MLRPSAPAATGASLRVGILQPVTRGAGQVLESDFSVAAGVVVQVRRVLSYSDRQLTRLHIS